MSSVSLNHHLVKVKGVYYYRARVPTRLVETLGMREIKYSLDTKDVTVARRLRTAADTDWAARFDHYETLHQPTSQPPPLRTATKTVQDYVASKHAEFLARQIQNGPETREQLNEMVIEAEMSLTALKSPGDPHREEWVSRLTSQLEGSSPATDQAKAELPELARRGLIEIYKRKLAVLNDSYEHQTFDHLFSPKSETESTFGALVDQFLAEHLESARVNGRTQKTIDKVQTQADLIREIIGEPTKVLDIGHDAVRNVQSILARTPANRNKVYPNLPLASAIERAKAEGKTVISPTTQAQYIDVFRSIMELAVKKRLTPSNPAQGVKPIKKEQVRAKDRRLPFTVAQIVQFFGSDFYEQCAPNAKIPYSKPDRDWRYWLPLICVLMGLRPVEACQMLATDVKRTVAGTYYFDIVASDDDSESSTSETKKTLKTESSRRRVPIHPELLKLGIVDYAERRRKKDPKARLLPGLKPDKYGNLATYALRRFRESYLIGSSATSLAACPRETLVHTGTLQHFEGVWIRRVFHRLLTGSLLLTAGQSA